MTTSTERENIAKVQAALNEIKSVAKIEMKGNVASGDAEHLNAWTEVHARTELLHSKLTKLGLRVFPEFFDEVVLRGGGQR